MSTETLKKKAEEAKEKKAVFGEDIHLQDFKEARRDMPTTESLESLSESDRRTLLNAGVMPSLEGRSGSFVLMDNTVVHESMQGSGVEVTSVQQALKNHDWLKDYSWKAVAVDADKYTARTYLEEADGYFIRALAGQKVKLPVQTCLMVKSKDAAQTVHNIIIIEEGAELEVLTGCASGHGVERALHLGISEFYIKKGAKLTFTMIHNWSETMGVRPRTVVIQEENSTYISNYVALRPVKTIQAYPTTRMDGAGAVARFSTVAIGHPGSELDLGGRALMNAPNTRCEIVSRTVSTGGKIISRGQLVGKASGIKAHLECKGLILNDKGIQIAIPELEAYVPDVEMTHEAAVGKIAQDQVEYLMSRGLTEDEAVGMIVRGFLDVSIMGLPDQLMAEIDATMKQADIGKM
jgi:Fe-S cluster assembly scaffold protein SufB